MAEADEDVPPLEDMSDYLQQLQRSRDKQSSSSIKPTEEKAKEKKIKRTVDSSLLQLEQEGGVRRSDKLLICDHVKPQLAENEQDQNTVSQHQTSSSDSSDKKPRPKASSKGFGGLKKGFLFSSSERTSQGSQRPSPAQSTGKQDPSRGGACLKEDNMPFVKGTAHKQKGVEFQEVQDELKRSYPLLATQDWVNEDLLTKIDKNPLLSKAFQDPSLSRTLQQFQQDPQGTIAAVQHKPELRKFLQEFCSVMGDHFTALADKEESKEDPLITDPDEEQMKEALTKPDVQAALGDPDIRKLIELLRTEPDKAQRLLQQSQSEIFHRKVKVLVDNGILAFMK